MKRILSMAAALLFLTLPAWQWTQSVVSPWDIFEHQLPPGQWLYLVSKLIAQYAFLLLTFQLMLGFMLVKQTIVLPWLSINIHRVIGISVFLVVLSHAGLFVMAAWLRSGHFPFEVLSLQFSKGYYAFYVSVGVLAACILCVVFLIGILRNRLPAIIFRYGHRMAWLVWLLGFFHSIAIGTETNSGLIWSWYYLSVAALIVMLMLSRIYLTLQPKLLLLIPSKQ